MARTKSEFRILRRHKDDSGENPYDYYTIVKPDDPPFENSVAALRAIRQNGDSGEFAVAAITKRIHITTKQVAETTVTEL